MEHLTVELLDGSNTQYVIDDSSFVVKPYWRCPLHNFGERNGPDLAFIAETVGPQTSVRAVNAKGDWQEVPTGAEVLCKNRWGHTRDAKGEVSCRKNEEYLAFDAADLKVVY